MDELKDRAATAASSVVDPELPMLTLADLGVLRSVELDDTDGRRVVVTLTPTYTGCPALATMRADVRLALAAAGFDDVEVRTSLSPAWSTDWISERGRQALQAHGIAPPGPAAGAAGAGPVPLRLLDAPPAASCPRCGSSDTRLVSAFGASACTAQHACRSCGEPFDKVKEL